MPVILIAAVAKNGVIGKDNKLVWKNAEDMARFKQLTSGAGKTVLMGRKTWESIPEKYRPLPDRRNVVITRQANYALPKDVLRFSSVPDAVDVLQRQGELWIIGGGEIYAAAMPFADQLEITRIDQDLEGNVLFPPINTEMWELEETVQPKTGTGFSFETYVRADMDDEESES